MSNKNIYPFLWNFVKKFKKEIIVLYIYEIIVDLLYLFVAGYFLSKITNKATNGDYKHIVLYGILYCFLLSYGYLHKVITKIIEYKVRKKIDKNYFLKLFNNTLNHEISFFSNNLTGQLTSKITNIQKKIEHIYFWSIDIISSMLTFFVGLVILYFINPKLSYFGLLWFIVYLPIIILILKWNFKISNENSENWTKSIGIINDCFTNIMNIKIFSNEKREFKTIKKQSHNILRSESKILFSVNILNIFNYISMGIFSFGILAIIFNDYINKEASIGTVIFISIYVFNIIFWVNTAIHICFDVISDIASIQNSIDTLMTEIKIKDKKNAKILESTEGKIIFKSLNFNYEITNKKLKA